MIGEKKRYWDLDFVRGICVLLMIFDHTMYSIADILPNLFGMRDVDFMYKLSNFAIEYWNWDFREIFRLFVCAAFFVLCGISCTFSRSNIIRGLKALLVSFLITFVTALFQAPIIFGVIHMLAFSMIIYGLLDVLGAQIQKIEDNAVTLWIRRLLPGVVGVFILVLFFTLFGGIYSRLGVINIYSDIVIKSNSKLKSLICILIEVRGVPFASADYYPLIPYSAMVLVGSIIGWLIYHTGAKNYLARCEKKCFAPICFLGRKALWVYVFHQVAIIAIMFIVAFMR